MSNATLFSPTLSGLRIAVLTLALAAGGAWAQGSQPAAEPGAPVLPKPIDPSTIPASEAPPPFNPAPAAPAKPPLFTGELADLIEGTQLEVVSANRSATEGPLWHDGALYFTDMRAGAIYKAVPGITPVNEPVQVRAEIAGAAGLAVDSDGTLYITAFREGLNSLTKDGTFTQLAESFDGKRFNSLNDLTIAKDGSIYFSDFGSNAKSELKQSGIYRRAKDGTITCESADFSMANGVCLSADGKTLYATDYSPLKREVRAFDVAADGKLSNSRTFVVVDDERAAPDGVKLDDKGNVYVAAAGGVIVYDKDAKRLGKINVGRTSNICFGGEGGKTLFITGGREVQMLKMKVAGVNVDTSAPKGEKPAPKPKQDEVVGSPMS
jgi:gluconolactonase